jgi:hypothetical protein
VSSRRRPHAFLIVLPIHAQVDHYGRKRTGMAGATDGPKVRALWDRLAAIGHVQMTGCCASRSVVPTSRAYPVLYSAAWRPEVPGHVYPEVPQGCVVSHRVTENGGQKLRP